MNLMIIFLLVSFVSCEDKNEESLRKSMHDSSKWNSEDHDYHNTFHDDENIKHLLNQIHDSQTDDYNRNHHDNDEKKEIDEKKISGYNKHENYDNSMSPNHRYENMRNGHFYDYPIDMEKYQLTEENKDLEERKFGKFKQNHNNGDDFHYFNRFRPYYQRDESLTLEEKSNEELNKKAEQKSGKEESEKKSKKTKTSKEKFNNFFHHKYNNGNFGHKNDQDHFFDMTSGEFNQPSHHFKYYNRYPNNYYQSYDSYPFHFSENYDRSPYHYNYNYGNYNGNSNQRMYDWFPQNGYYDNQNFNDYMPWNDMGFFMKKNIHESGNHGYHNNNYFSDKFHMKYDDQDTRQGSHYQKSNIQKKFFGQNDNSFENNFQNSMMMQYPMRGHQMGFPNFNNAMSFNGMGDQYWPNEFGNYHFMNQQYGPYNHGYYHNGNDDFGMNSDSNYQRYMFPGSHFYGYPMNYQGSFSRYNNMMGRGDYNKRSLSQHEIEKKEFKNTSSYRDHYRQHDQQYQPFWKNLMSQFSRYYDENSPDYDRDFYEMMEGFMNENGESLDGWNWDKHHQNHYNNKNEGKGEMNNISSKTNNSNDLDGKNEASKKDN